ncbi:hypothetical protein BKA66DRAFT_571209 [Pyrenochaeta sp. MPI-SDFR-AT-0127]|nr:hypothetical protein BKA66DRAFT_571209 [Pyrenochaeta sp. MPI-SDFR-AT-0127]
MRLLQIQQDGSLILTKDLIGDGERPAYAILSHTWTEGEEVSFDEFVNNTGHDKAGYNKIRFCAQQALRDGLRYFWVDTCCINKANTVELQDAINSMFRWYQDADRCYVLLSGVKAPEADTGNTTCALSWKRGFRNSKWFTRGWTLQELLAPRSVLFFSQEGKYLGKRYDLRQEIHEITSIPISALASAPLDSFSINDRLSWANRRYTTRAEDKAYSLLGIFGVFMFLNYGEGQDNAFKRLRKAIEEESQEAAQPQTQLMTDGGRSTFDRVASYHIQFPKNPHFVGRKDELDMLSQKLLIDRDCQKMSIVGLGGTGKTQVALRFAYTVKETMSAVSIFWMPALSMESFEQACVSIVAALRIGQAGSGEDDAKEILRDYLSTERAGRWLIVLDNADDSRLLFGTEQSRGIVDFLPESEKGMTVFTTRIQEVAVSLTRGDVLELGSMGQLDAVDFLKRSLIKKDLTQNSKATEELLDELMYLPLAIAQAAAYLNMNRTTIAQYLRLLRSTEQDIIGLMSKEFRDYTRYRGSANAIALTWVVSFTQLQEHDAVAADLLAFMSCIEWKAIPRSLLPKVQPEERMEEAIGTLCGYSFVSRREDDGLDEPGEEEEWYDLHRLVHLATRIWINKYGDAADVTQKATKHVAEVFPSDDFANQAIWRRYMPHALQLLETKHSCSVECRAALCLCVGRCLHEDGRVKEAVKWLEESYRLRVVLEETHPGRLRSEHALGFSYQANGQAKESVALLEHVVEVHNTILPEAHRDRLASRHTLAMSYQANGQIKESVALLEHVVEVHKTMLPETDPDRLRSQHALGISYWANRQIHEAVVLLEHVVKVYNTTLAESHPDRLASQHALGVSYRANGQTQDAVALLEHVVTVSKATLAESHPDRLASQQALGVSYWANGQIKEAVALLEHVVTARNTTLAETHPSRLASQHALGVSYWANGQIKEAVALLEHVVRVRKTTLAETHDDRLFSEKWLAYIISEQE